MNVMNVGPAVRLATMDDLEDLLSMGRELHKENGLLNLDEALIRQGALDAINGNHSVVGVIGPTGHMEGAIHLAFRRFWYTSDWHLEELWAYVRPQYRRSTNAKALVQYAKHCAETLKVPLLIGILSNTQTEAKVALYRRQLGAPSGAYFLYNAKTGS
jgi:GNAT superfamily N-acetyltransferase